MPGDDSPILSRCHLTLPSHHPLTHKPTLNCRSIPLHTIYCLSLPLRDPHSPSHHPISSPGSPGGIVAGLVIVVIVVIVIAIIAVIAVVW